MMQERIEREVRRVVDRNRQLRLRRALAIAWALGSVFGLGFLAAEWLWGAHVPWAVPALLGGVLVLGAVAFWRTWRGSPDASWAAHRIESTHPELRTGLLAALEQKPRIPGGRFGFLQEVLLRDVLKHARRRRWREVVPDRRLRRARAANLSSFIVFTGVLVGLVAVGDAARERSESAGGALGGSGGAGAREATVVAVDPGDAEIERGSSLLVLARFSGTVPLRATLVAQNDAGEELRAVMARSLDDPLFAAQLASVDTDLSYRVEFDGEQSSSYRVTVFDFPELERADARMVYPDYTNLEAKTILDTRQVRAVEGTELTWICHLNKQVVRARLLADDGSTVELAAGEGEAEKVYSGSLTVSKTGRYRVHLVDADGRENRERTELAVRLLLNRAPQLEVVAPGRDVRVSPLEELALEAKARDDFGLLGSGLSYTVAGQATQEISLATGGEEGRSTLVRHLLDFEALESDPDQLVSYTFWAEDVAPSGAARRTYSDMYFAEVRHFEEIFRQGEQPPEGAEAERDGQGGEGAAGGAAQNARDAEDLAELQKQIMSGTWNLIRREAGGPPQTGSTEGDLVEDATLLRDSQLSVLERTEPLAERLEDAESRRHLEAVQEHMSAAVEKLTEAADGPSADALSLALSSEQSAYQSLLKLRAREFRVIRGAQRQSPGQGNSAGGQNRSERQLQQLELSNSRNRYETQRSAAARRENSSREREDRQVSNRLRELARRQADLNERLKELESALAEARSEEEREEIERRLKRLREEEQQLLRDADELAERMEAPENQERMADAREQLGQGRENVRRASEALRTGQVSRAVAEGTRAERELRELDDEFRRRTGAQFSDEMRELLTDAQELDRVEEDLSERLSELGDEQESSLRGTTEREQVEEGLREQRQRLQDLLEEMETTIEEAETPEPLLADKLYETVRTTRNERTDESLDVARRLLENGFVDQSGEAERQAREGIRALREGVEEAAESVLGDGTEALRRARDAIERLAEEVEGEIARATAREDTPGSPTGASAQEESGEPVARAPSTPSRGGEPGERSGEEPAGGSSAGERSGEEPAGGSSAEERGEEGGRRGAPREGGDTPRARPGGLRTARGGLRRGGDPQGGGGLRPFLESGEEAPEDGGAREASDRELSPIAGEDFRDWSDRLRDVEEMVDDDALRGDAARIRDRARGIRSEVKRHSKEPNWDLVRVSIVEPLNELRQRVSDELSRRESQDALVPIDADPVPPRFAEWVEQYYERLGSGE